MRLQPGRSCVLMGEQSLLIACGRELITRGFIIAAVVTESAAIRTWADGHSIATIVPTGPLSQSLAEIEYDWFFSIANLRIVPDAVWRKAKHGAVNFHDGPLPTYAGLNAPCWAILAGARQYGITWHALTERVDEGGIYVQKTFDVQPDETAFTLNARCYEAGLDGFHELLTAIEAGHATTVAQAGGSQTYYLKSARPAAGGTLDLRLTNAVIGQLVRALDHGPGFANPVALPKLSTRTGAVNITACRLLPGKSMAAPGTVLDVDAVCAKIATGDGVILVEGLSDAVGLRVAIPELLTPGDVLEPLTDVQASRLTAHLAAVATCDDAIRRELSCVHDIEIVGLKPPAEGAGAAFETVRLPVPQTLSPDGVIAAIAAGFARLGDQSRFGVAFSDDASASAAVEFPGYISSILPLNFDISQTALVAEVASHVRASLDRLRNLAGFSGDLISRSPTLAAFQPTVGIVLTETADRKDALPGAVLTFVVPAQPPASTVSDLRVIVDTLRLSRADAESLLAAMGHVLQGFASSESLVIGDLPVMAADQRDEMVFGVNATARDYDQSQRVHSLFERQVEHTPDAVALVAVDGTLSYRQVDTYADQIAAHLIAHGVWLDILVGLYVDRSVGLVAGALGILKAGGAYVPLDPTYPADRIGLMIEDSRLGVIVTTRAFSKTVPAGSAHVLILEDLVSKPAGQHTVRGHAASDSLAYVIYTSGSTGRPKGVMIEHRNVVNFFAGMDDRISVPTDTQPVWLAVTSLSFDISVLELFWTLSRGFKVVLYSPMPK